MSDERRVRIVREGQRQAISIPREFALPGDEAILRREAGRLIVEPAPRRSLEAVLATLEPLDDEFPPIRDLPIDDVEL